MTVECELCNKEIDGVYFQKHLIEEHNILVCQYTGLISEKIDIANKRKKENE